MFRSGVPGSTLLGVGVPGKARRRLASQAEKEALCASEALLRADYDVVVSVIAELQRHGAPEPKLRPQGPRRDSRWSGHK